MIDPKTHRVHTSFNQTVAATGRLSSSAPNLQNIPARTELGQKIREAFIAEKNSKLIAFDYSQIELRILAHFSEDKKLIEAFKGDLDIHAVTASQIFKVPLEAVTSQQRRAAKTINFGIIYGMGALSLAESLKISRTEAQEYINKYFENYHDVREFLNSILEGAKEKGYVETLYGRRRYFPEIAGPASRFRSFAERAAINAPLQGTAADIIKLAMVRVRGQTPLSRRTEVSVPKMILQVHDELVFEVPEEEVSVVSKSITKIMEEIVELKVPLKVSCGFGNSWAEAG
jgi:DNA polymerase-1